MQAIGNYILDDNIETKVLYQKASDFLEVYVSKVSSNQMEDFNEQYRSVDVLLIDDIQQLSDKKNTQMEFFKVFDYLTNKNKQIVLTSDKPANELKNMMSRLTSRFQQGLVVDISVPDLEHRVEILRKKLLLEAPESVGKVEDEVLEFIASYFTTNIRELEGALKRVLYYCMISNIPITVENAEEALEPLIKTKKNTSSVSENDYDKVLSVTADYYGVSVHDLIGTSRKAVYTLPRHIAMYLIKMKYNLPFKTIGSFFSNRDHSTVLSAVTKIEESKKYDSELNMAIEHITRKLDN
jgi:chromosomal replication initiator protein